MRRMQVSAKSIEFQLRKSHQAKLVSTSWITFSYEITPLNWIAIIEDYVELIL